MRLASLIAVLLVGQANASTPPLVSGSPAMSSPGSAPTASLPACTSTKHGSLIYDETTDKMNFCTASNTFSELAAASVSGTGWTASGGDLYNPNAGNVGVGAAPGAYKLDVAGTCHASGKLTVDAVIESTSGGFKFPDGVTLTTAPANSWISASTNIYNPNAGNVGIGAAPGAFKLDVAGWMRIAAPVVASATAPAALLITGGAHTGLTASTEAPDVNISLSRTVQFATGALTNQRAVKITPPTYAFIGASTISTAASFAVTGPPVAGAQCTITEPLAAWFGGDTRVDGQLRLKAGDYSNLSLSFENSVDTGIDNGSTPGSMRLWGAGDLLVRMNNGVIELFKTMRTMGGLTVAIATKTSSPYTMAYTDHVVRTNSASAFVLNLPSCPGLPDIGQVYTLKNINTGVLTVTPNGGDLIDGAASLVLAKQYQSVDLICDGTNWSTFGASAPAASAGAWGAEAIGVLADNVNFTGAYRSTANTPRFRAVTCSWSAAGTDGLGTGVVIKVRNTSDGTDLCTCTLGACSTAANTPLSCDCNTASLALKNYTLRFDASTDCTINPTNTICSVEMTQ